MCISVSKAALEPIIDLTKKRYRDESDLQIDNLVENKRRSWIKNSPREDHEKTSVSSATSDHHSPNIFQKEANLNNYT